MTVLYRSPRIPQWIRRGWARLAGYFWLPCPRCHHMFAGYEAGSDSVTDSDGASWTCCRYCEDMGA